MSFARRISTCFLIVVYLLTACGPALTPNPILSTITPGLNHTPTNTSIVVPTSLPASEATTPIPCDTNSADYCIEEKVFLSQRPIIPPAVNQIDHSYPYLTRADGTREIHHGVEFPNASDTPVFAAEGGTVVYAGDDTINRFSPWSDFYGNLVVLEHILPTDTLYTLYAHLSTVIVNQGETVPAGKKIGEVGATGGAMGSHLHFEVRQDAYDYYSTINPELWLPPLPDTGILVIRSVDTDGNFVRPSISIQFFPDPASAFTQAWQPDPYTPEMQNPEYWENTVLGELPYGRHRISLVWAGIWQERWIDIESGKITRVEFTLKP